MEKQVACIKTSCASHLINEYCIFAQYCYYEYTYLLHSSAPARDTVITSIHTYYIRPHLPEIRLYFQMNLHSLKLPDKTSILSEKTSLLLRREHQPFEDGCCITFCCEPAGEASRKRLFRIDRDRVYSRGGGAPDCMIFTSPDSILKKDTRPKDQGLKKDFRGYHRSKIARDHQHARRGVR